jgi:type III pantothenate kinase
MSEFELIALNVGNTRTQLGRFQAGAMVETQRLDNDNVPAITEAVTKAWKNVDSGKAAIVMASVNLRVADALASMIEDQLSQHVYQVGVDLPIPINVMLDPETITGVDRLLNAVAAFDRVKQACVVVDAGTAVTVDFVDGEGTYHGGAIAPGARMQLRALHERTSALPEVDFAAPDHEAFGRSTAQAMLRGVYHGIVGMVRRLVEVYAERYGAYPTVVATGGDAETLFKNDELIDRIVPELTLIGIEAAARHALAGESDEARQRPDAQSN